MSNENRIELKKIASFTVDHTTLKEGMYISRIDDDIITYDIRMVLPNGGIYLPIEGMHTIEHLFATYARSSEFADSVIYVGPMGCRTGFYLLTRNLPHADAIKLVKDSFAFIMGFSGWIPGRYAKECGNYIEHSLEKAKEFTAPMIDVLKDWTVDKLNY